MSKLWLSVENLKYIEIKVLTYVGAFLLLKRERNMSDIAKTGLKVVTGFVVSDGLTKYKL